MENMFCPDVCNQMATKDNPSKRKLAGVFLPPADVDIRFALAIIFTNRGHQIHKNEVITRLRK